MAAEIESPRSRPPEPITIMILRIRNLRGTKGDIVNATVKVEFGDKPLGESLKQECTPDIPAEFNFSVNLLCTYDDPICMDDITHKPVVVTISEVLAKEKKQKEEKMNILGQCCIDLLPLIKGSTEIWQILPIIPVAETPQDAMVSNDFKPEIEIRVNVAEPLLDESRLNENNMLTVSLGSLYSTPEAWSITGTQYTYGVALPVPLLGDKELPVMFINGKLKPAQDKEGLQKQKKWAVPGTAIGNAAFMTDKFLFTDVLENDDGDYKGKDDIEHRKNAEQEKSRVTWNMERRCYLQASALKNFQDSIVKNHYWPVEVMRLSALTGGKSKKDDDTTVTFHGVAFMNLSPFLYPGVTCIKGAFKVVGFSESLLFEKTNRKFGLSDEIGKVSGWQNKFSISSIKKSNKEVEKKEPKKIGQAKSESGLDPDVPQQSTVEGHQYVDAKSYIMIEICLDKPLIPKRTYDDLIKKSVYEHKVTDESDAIVTTSSWISELIPPRALYPRRTDNAQKAVEDFHSQVATVAGHVLDDFRELFGDELKNSGPQTSEAMEARRQILVYELNSSGKYFSIKEQIKHSVVKIVREKYLRTTNFENKEELQTFLSELYVYLIDQMHVSLGKVLALEDQPPVPKPLTDSHQLKHFAREAEMNQNFDLASTYYKERIARNKNSADCWFDFGTFNLYIHDITKAEECFKECIAINQKHLHGLLLYGVVCVLSERNEIADTFFEAATCVHPSSILAWTMLGLFYDAVSNEIGAEMAYAEANKLNLAKAIEIAETIKAQDEALKKDSEHITDSRNQEGMEPTNEGGLSTTNIDTGLQTPDKDVTPSGRSRSVVSKSGQLSPLMSLTITANEQLAGHITSQITSQITGQITGQNVPQPSGIQSEKQLPQESMTVPATSIYMEATDWLLEVKALSFAERALGHELLTCPGGPNIDFHIAMAKLFLQKGDYSEAEHNLNEALQMNIQNQDVWSLMGHVKYLTRDTENAKHCYERTLAFVTDACETHSVYLRLASIYLQEERYSDAKSTFLMACKKSPSCISWLGVGIACYRLEEFSEAEDALSEANILNNNDSEVWAYLSLVCLKTNRRLQAEQAYKYAIKLNLEEGPLLAEIHGEQARYGFGNPAF